MKNKRKYILTGYAHPSIKSYRPTVNQKKRGLLIGLVAVCLVTPGTNWMFPLVLKGISKFNPLWIYR